MSRITSKLQVTIPKVVAEQVGIRVGDDVRFEVLGEVIVLRPARLAQGAMSLNDRMALFDAATQRQGERNLVLIDLPPEGRGWTREELYERAMPH